jgi:hypothetical protein
MAVRRNIVGALLVLASGAALAVLFRKPPADVPTCHPDAVAWAWRDAVVPPPQGSATLSSAPQRGTPDARKLDPPPQTQGRRTGPSPAIPATPPGARESAAAASSALDRTAPPPPLATAFPEVGLAGPPPRHDRHADRSAPSDDPAAGTDPSPQWLVHIVADGDSLTALAARYWGDPSRGPEILHDNREWISDPDVLPIGVPLRIRLSADDDFPGAPRP